MRTLTTPQGWLLIATFGALMFTAATLTTKGRARSKLEFLVASRRITWPRAALAVAANWIWAPALFVAAEQGYRHGWVGVFWFTVPNVACLVLFAGFMRRARDRFPNGLTAAGAAGSLYSARVRRLYLVTFTGLAVCSFAVQMLAGGLVLTALTGIPFTAITVALALIALSYAVRLGMRASVATKVVDMTIIIVVGVGLALAVAFTAGASTLTAGLGGIDGTMTSLTSGAGAGVFWSFGLATTIGLISGPFGDQSFWQIGYSVERRHVRRSFIAGAAAFALIPAGMSLLGFAAAGARLTVDDPQLTNLTAILHWLPAWTAIPFTLYIFAGLVSTMDSQLCSVSALIGEAASGLPGRRVGPLTAARASMVILAVVGVLIANVPGIAVVQLFIFYGTLRASTLVTTMLMLTRPQRRLNERGAFYGIIAALAVGIPMSAVGNLNGIVPLIVAGSLAVIALPAATTALLPPTAARRGAARPSTTDTAPEAAQR